MAMRIPSCVDLPKVAVVPVRDPYSPMGIVSPAAPPAPFSPAGGQPRKERERAATVRAGSRLSFFILFHPFKIGRASCRERVWSWGVNGGVRENGGERSRDKRRM